MENNPELQPKQALHRYVRVAVFAILGIFVGAFLTDSFLMYQHTLKEQNTQNELVISTTTPLFARSAPTTLKIPKLDIDVDFETPLGLNPDNTIEVPDSYEKVGWYKNGATPGEVGTAVVLGHVDSYKGPAVFFSLPNLQKGDEIEVLREDGTTAVFKVDDIQRYSRDKFPTELVYGQTEVPSLRLVTCTGTFNRGQQLYSHNLVVFASLVEPK